MCQGRVYFRREANKPQAGQAALVAYKSGPWGETAFSMQTGCVGGGKTVRDPPRDPMPKDGHWVHDSLGGAPNGRPVQETRGKERLCQRETEVWRKAHSRSGEAADSG